MPRRPGPTARSSSRSSKRAEGAAAAPPETRAGWLAVGEVVAAHGLRGLLRVRAYQPPAPSLGPDRLIRLEQAGAGREIRIAAAAPHGRGLVLVALAGVGDREAAEALVGSRVLVRTADLPPAADDEFYYYEVVGFRVETAGGEPPPAARSRSPCTSSATMRAAATCRWTTRPTAAVRAWS